MKLITYSLKDKLTFIEESCIKSWIKNGYEVDIYCYCKNPTNLKINIKNAEKLIKKEEIDKIKLEIFQKFFFKIKINYLIGGIIIDPDVFCIKKYDFKENTLVSSSPSPNYLESKPDFCIFKFPKRSKEIHYIVHHFFMVYHDTVNGYNTSHTISDLLIRLVNKVFKLNKKDWKFSNSCNEEHWKLQLNIYLDITRLRSFSGGNKDYIEDEKNLGNFLKIWQDDILLNIPNFDIKNYKNSILEKILR